MNEKRIDLPKMEGHYCFGCGTENPIGLNLYFYATGDYVCADFTPGKNNEGWENIMLKQSILQQHHMSYLLLSIDNAEVLVVFALILLLLLAICQEMKGRFRGSLFSLSQYFALFSNEIKEIF